MMYILLFYAYFYRNRSINYVGNTFLRTFKQYEKRRANKLNYMWKMSDKDFHVLVEAYLINWNRLMGFVKTVFDRNNLLNAYFFKSMNGIFSLS